MGVTLGVFSPGQNRGSVPSKEELIMAYRRRIRRTARRVGRAIGGAARAAARHQARAVDLQRRSAVDLAAGQRQAGRAALSGLRRGAAAVARHLVTPRRSIALEVLGIHPTTTPKKPKLRPVRDRIRPVRAGLAPRAPAAAPRRPHRRDLRKVRRQRGPNYRRGL